MIAVLHNRRGSCSKAKVMRVAGDVAARPCLVIEDMMSTGCTVAETVAVPLASGARPEITVAAPSARSTRRFKPYRRYFDGLIAMEFKHSIRIILRRKHSIVQPQTIMTIALLAMAGLSGGCAYLACAGAGSPGVKGRHYRCDIRDLGSSGVV